jgi:chorismate mutase
LVKAEKERDDVIKEVGELKEKDKTDKARERVEKIRMQSEIEQANLEREKAVAGLRIQFDKEVALLKDKQEKEIQVLKGQFESEAAATKVCFASRSRASV